MLAEAPKHASTVNFLDITSRIGVDSTGHLTGDRGDGTITTWESSDANVEGLLYEWETLGLTGWLLNHRHWSAVRYMRGKSYKGKSYFLMEWRNEKAVA